jgi:hypothetical protein
MNTSWFGVVVGQGLAQRDHRTVSSAPWGVVLRPPSFPWLESLRRPCRCDSDAHNLGSDISRLTSHEDATRVNNQERFRYAVQADFVVTDRIRPLPSIVKRRVSWTDPKKI